MEVDEPVPFQESARGRPEVERGSVEAVFAERIAAAQLPEEHGDPLSMSDHVQLFVAGVAIPIIILVLGWIING